MLDTLNRQLEKGDVVLQLGSWHTPTCALVPQSADGVMRGLRIYLRRDPSKEEIAELQKPKYRGYGPEWYNVRYSLKFGKVTWRRRGRLMKVNSLPIDEYLHCNMPFSVSSNETLCPEMLEVMKAVYKEAQAYCIDRIKQGLAVTVPKHLRYIENPKSPAAKPATTNTNGEQKQS